MTRLMAQRLGLNADPARDTRRWESMIKHLAADLHTPEAQVEAILQSEVRQLQRHARIKDFILILAARRVKELIK